MFASSKGEQINPTASLTPLLGSPLGQFNRSWQDIDARDSGAHVCRENGIVSVAAAHIEHLFALQILDNVKPKFLRKRLRGKPRRSVRGRWPGSSAPVFPHPGQEHCLLFPS